MRRLTPGQHHQQGAVLFAGLVILMLMTLTAVFSMRHSVIIEKISGNALEKLRADQAAEITVKVAENHLQHQLDLLAYYNAGTTDAVAGLYKESSSNHPWLNESSWQNTDTVTVTDASLPAEVSLSSATVDAMQLNQTPRYMMGLNDEILLDGMDSDIRQKFFSFIVTSRSTSQLPHIRTTLQAEIVEAY